MTPLHLGSPASFGALRAFLQDSGYSEETVCERYGLGAQHEILGSSRPAPPAGKRDAAELLIRLFITGGYAQQAELTQHFPPDALAAAWELGLVTPDESKPGRVYSPVCLYPLRRLFIASDRWTNPDGSPYTPGADVVYPAITRNTYRFLGLLPSAPCERLLDLCSGSGVAALLAASGGARLAWAVDITSRSTRFAGFNRLLNGVANLTALEGDLYEPVAKLAFDRIVAHPPYLPSAATRWIFQDAGVQGEEITRRIVEGLPDHLTAGGRLYCLALGADQRGRPLEDRIRAWLGVAQAEFDVLVAAVETHTPEQIASQPLLRGEITQKEYASRRASFARAEIEAFVYGLFIVQRAGRPGRAPFTVRRQMGARTGSAELEWAVRWESMASSAEAQSLLLESRPARSRDLELCVVHRPREGALEPQDFNLQTDYPFSMESRVPPWTAALIAACDGVRTGRELRAYCVEDGLISDAVPAADFARLLGSLVSGGFLEIEACPLPRSAD
ncbi:MAG: methyltransferase [Bryobacterales bacterium]|nr:methyltransferase [Bryobacterales bacterium]